MRYSHAQTPTNPRRRIRRGTNDEGWIGKDAEGLSYPEVRVLGCRRVMKFATVMRGFGIRVTR